VHARKAFDILAVLVEVKAERREQKLRVGPVQSGLRLEPGDLFVGCCRERAFAREVVLQAGLKDAPAEVFLVVRNIRVELPLDDDGAVLDQVFTDIAVGDQHGDAQLRQAIGVANSGTLENAGRGHSAAAENDFPRCLDRLRLAALGSVDSDRALAVEHHLVDRRVGEDGQVCAAADRIDECGRRADPAAFVHRARRVADAFDIVGRIGVGLFLPTH
jgi:hypothetical protein